jgi:hypothetical protein
MAFPSVPNRNSSEHATPATSHTVNLPAGISAGELLIVQFLVRGNPVVTWPAGWTTAINDGPDVGNTSRTEVHYRFADGSEGASITITTDAAQNSGHRSWRITGAHESTPPEGAAATGFSATPDPPNLDTAVWTDEDALWLALMGIPASESISVYPLTYTNTFTMRTTGGPTLGCGERSLNAPVENPSSFTIPAGANWRAVTVAVRPAISDTDSFGTRRSMVS